MYEEAGFVFRPIPQKKQKKRKQDQESSEVVSAQCNNSKGSQPEWTKSDPLCPNKICCVIRQIEGQFEEGRHSTPHPRAPPPDRFVKLFHCPTGKILGSAKPAVAGRRRVNRTTENNPIADIKWRRDRAGNRDRQTEFPCGSRPIPMPCCGQNDYAASGKREKRQQAGIFCSRSPRPQNIPKAAHSCLRSASNPIRAAASTNAAYRPSTKHACDPT